MAKERAIRSLMFRALKQGSSFASFYKSAREHGFATYRRADMLSDWSDVRSEVQNVTRYKSLAAGEIPPVTEIGSLKFTQPHKYYYRLRTEAETVRGGPLVERFVTVASEKPLTLSEITSQVSRKWPGYEYGKAERLKKMELVAALHRAS